MELLRDAEGNPILACGSASGFVLPSGHVLLTLQNGQAKLPQLSVLEKTDSFRQGARESVGGFRLAAAVVAQTADSGYAPVESVAPAVSEKFVVKTQRACSDYRKVEFPHYRTKITDLRKRWDEVDADSPSVPQKLYDKVVASLQRSPTPAKGD